MKPRIELIDPEMIETNYNRADWTTVMGLSFIAATIAHMFYHLVIIV